MDKSEKQRAYARGYYVGMKRILRNAWPDYAPPSPPEEHVRRLIEAAKRIRDAADHVLQVIEPDEPVFQELADSLNPIDAALLAITAWLKSLPVPTSGQEKL